MNYLVKDKDKIVIYDVNEKEDIYQYRKQKLEESISPICTVSIRVKEPFDTIEKKLSVNDIEIKEYIKPSKQEKEELMKMKKEILEDYYTGHIFDYKHKEAIDEDTYDFYKSNIVLFPGNVKVIHNKRLDTYFTSDAIHLTQELEILEQIRKGEKVDLKQIKDQLNCFSFDKIGEVDSKLVESLFDSKITYFYQGYYRNPMKYTNERAEYGAKLMELVRR